MDNRDVKEREVIRVAAVGDLHCPRTSPDELRELFENLANEADVLLLCGDLTDYGKPDEARVLADHPRAGQTRANSRRPGKPRVTNVANTTRSPLFLRRGGATVLDGTAIEVLGSGIGRY